MKTKWRSFFYSLNRSITYLIKKITSVVDLPGMNVILWKFGNKSSFTVKSVYNALSTNDVGPYHKKIWKGKIPAKIKIFLWLVMNNAILTKDNLIRRKWAGNPTCHFCDKEESISHLLFQCSTAKAVWAVVAYALGADNVPRNIQQCWEWCEKWLPNGQTFHTLGIAAILVICARPCAREMAENLSGKWHNADK